MTEFRMPTLGADMEAGTLVEWLKHPGDLVRRGDIIAVVDTEKGAIEIEVFEDGVLERTVVEPGQKVPVGTVLALIRAPGEAPGAAVVAPAPAVAPPQEPAPATASKAAVAGVEGAVRRARSSPAARKAATDLHVDLSMVEGHGPGGSITVADVERAAARQGAAPEAPDRRTAMRTAIGAAMARSKREIPHLYLSSTVDLTATLAWLTAENARRPVTERLLPAVLFVRAVARAVSEMPGLNGFWGESGFAPGRGVHVGCAIALRGGGLIAPAIHDVASKTIDELARDFADLVRRARAGGLRSSEISDATITVTNLGELGVDAAYAIIYPPQVAIVSFGRVVERPWVVEGRIEPRSVVTIGLSVDHRVADGRDAGLFLAAIERALQPPGTS